MTTIFLAGAENPTHQDILRDAGAPNLAVNVGSMLRRRASWDLHIPYDYEWIAYSDAPASLDELLEIIDLADKPPCMVVGPPEWEEWGGEYLPLWTGVGEPPVASDGLVVTDAVFKDKDLVRRALAGRKAGTKLGAITGSSAKMIGRFDFVISAAWWSVMKFGETQVWDGTKMHRYNAERKIEVRQLHYNHIENLGIDAEEVLRQNPTELALLAVTSWIKYSDHLNRNPVTPLGAKLHEAQATIEPGSDIEVSGSDPQSLAIGPLRGRHEAQTLPVMGIETITSTYRMGDGSEVIEEVPVLKSQPTSLRQCDNCFLANSCPEFKPGASCAFSIPVEISTKDQLKAVMQAVIEIQTQRVLQARFAEEVSGQELSKEFGQETDRLFNIINKMKEISDDRDLVKISVEAKGNNGVLSRLFGSDVGANARQLAHPVHSDDIIDAMVTDE